MHGVRSNGVIVVGAVGLWVVVIMGLCCWISRGMLVEVCWWGPGGYGGGGSDVL